MFIDKLEKAYIGDVAENPAMQWAIDAQINESIKQSEFVRDFKSQYVVFNDIGLNIIEMHNNEEIPIAIADDFLEHVHSNILSIPDYDIPNLATYKIVFLTKAVYELLYVDIPSKFEEIIGDSSNEKDIKNNILNYFNMSIDILKRATDSVSWRQAKASFAIDLFDNDLEQFLSNYVIPIRNKLN